VGSVLLQKAYDTRIEIQGLARAAIAEIPQMLQKIGLIGLAKDQRNRLVTSNVFTSMEEGMDHISVEKKGMHYLYEADGFAIENKYELAKNLYENQIWVTISKIKLHAYIFVCLIYTTCIKYIIGVTSHASYRYKVTGYLLWETREALSKTRTIRSRYCRIRQTIIIGK
jgi:uncharacterized protein (DUF362 family)